MSSAEEDIVPPEETNTEPPLAVKTSLSPTQSPSRMNDSQLLHTTGLDLNEAADNVKQDALSSAAISPRTASGRSHVKEGTQEEKGVFK